MGNFLTKKQRKELKSELRSQKLQKYSDRIKAILLLDMGKTYKNISCFLFLDEGTVANYLKRYKEGGIEGLINDNYSGRRSMLTEKEKDILSSELQRRIYPNVKEIIAYTLKRFGVEYSQTGMTNLLHSLGFSYKKATPIPGKANRKEQEKFIKKYRNLIGKGDIYFGDSTHPEFAPDISRGWIETGEKFNVKTNSGYKKRVNIYGAININNLHTLTRTAKSINHSTVRKFLYDLRKKNPDNKSIFFILDGAAYNRAGPVKKTAKALNIKLVYLPAYSPNLNLIERLWKFMKTKVTANKYFEEFDDFKLALVNFFRGIRKYRCELKTLMTDNFPILGT